jgi:DNA recombination-dependent growth factor C
MVLGWVTKQLASRADADDGIALLRESYDALRAALASAARSQS